MVVQRLLMNYVGGGDDGLEGELSLFISLLFTIKWRGEGLTC
jgi:hypothetical protein